MTDCSSGLQRSHARSNRARILAAAREELSRDPDASLDEIARAAGVVRRTLYGHFPNREALVTALAQEAKQALQEAFTAARRPGADPPTALARLILASWAVGGRYRMLISLARRDLGEERIRAALAPARAEAAAILGRGQQDGTFASHLPAPVLALATESMALAVLESHTSSHWSDPTGEAAAWSDPTGEAAAWSDPTGEAAATAVLIAAGIDRTSARRYVHTILAEDTPGPPA
jgi:AcrR family transcriptional regulator